jgi:hypothetical protein
MTIVDVTLVGFAFNSKKDEEEEEYFKLFLLLDALHYMH